MEKFSLSKIRNQVENLLLFVTTYHDVDGTRMTRIERIVTDLTIRVVMDFFRLNSNRQICGNPPDPCHPCSIYIMVSSYYYF